MIRQAFPALLTAFIITTINGSPALASDDLLPACRLLSANDLKQVKFEMTGRPRGNSFAVTREQSGAPAELQADVCFFYSGMEGGRFSANVMVETFADSTGVADWIATKNSKVSSDGATLVKLDDATCEEGRYVFSDANDNTRGNKQEQRYVSCDRLRDNMHVIIGFEVPADSGHIPETSAVAALLDTVITRLSVPAR